MNSRLYHGSTWHTRTEQRYAFRYGVFYFYLDLDEIEEVDRRIRLFGYNRTNVLSLHDRDHVGEPGQGVRSAARERLQASGFDLGTGSVSLLTAPRVLGHVFNPVSFYFGRGPAGGLQRVLAEVHNTWGERHVYDLERATPDGPYTAKAEKAFYVSPFIQMDARYEFHFLETDARLRVQIDEFRGEERFFRAGIDVRSLPLTNANVARLLLRYPFVTLKTIAAIHWQGLKLWLRGVPFNPNPSRRTALAARDSDRLTRV
jgi:DUF1365 family protein